MLNGKQQNCEYLKIVVIPLFTKLFWPGVSEGTSGFRIKLLPAHLSTTAKWRLHTAPFNAELQAVKVSLPHLKSLF